MTNINERPILKRVLMTSRDQFEQAAEDQNCTLEWYQSKISVRCGHTAINAEVIREIPSPVKAG